MVSFLFHKVGNIFLTSLVQMNPGLYGKMVFLIFENNLEIFIAHFLTTQSYYTLARALSERGVQKH